MNFDRLEELIQERKVILDILRLLKTPDYKVFVSYDRRLEVIDFPPDIQKDLKDIAIGMCKQKVTDTEKEIRRLNGLW